MRRLLVVLLSVIGGILAALVHAASVGPDAGLKTLALPGVVPVATVVGAAAGFLISPVMIWATKGRDLKTAVPCAYAFSCAAVALLDLIQARRSMYISLALSVLMLCVYRFIGRKKP